MVDEVGERKEREQEVEGGGRDAGGERLADYQWSAGLFCCCYSNNCVLCHSSGADSGSGDHRPNLHRSRGQPRIQ